MRGFVLYSHMLMDASLWLFCVATAAVLLSRTFLQSYLRSVWLVLRLPGPKALPFVGHAHWALDSKRLVKAAVELPKKWGLTMGIWLAVFPVVYVNDPLHIQKILTNSKHIEKLNIYKMMHNFIGEGLITSDGARWKIHRRLMQPTFSLSILESFVNVFNKGANIIVQNLQNQISTTGCNAVKITPFVNQMVFSLLTEAVLGVAMESAASKKVQNESPYRSGSTSMIYRLLRPWLLFPALFHITQTAKKEIDQKNALVNFTKNSLAMDERKKLYKEDTAIDQKCFLDHLLQIVAENEDIFTEDDCAQEACTLMLAGQDSVGAAIAFTLHCLANNPTQQKKAFNEQMEIFGESKGPATLSDLRKMTYLEMCLKEAMRLYPSVPMIGRTLGEDIQLGKWRLPKGCNVLISPFSVHRLEEYYQQPEKFVPERFEPSVYAQRPIFSYIPFSGGPRNCIGYKYAELEMKTILSTILRNFELSRVEGHEELTISYRITLRASGGVWVTLKPRNASQIPKNS